MFRPLSLWQQIPCPALEARGSCSIAHCLFSHNLLSSTPLVLVSSTPAIVSADLQAQETLKDTVKTAGIDDGSLLLSGDPRLRRIVENNFGNNHNDEGKRENKRRKLSDDEDSISSSSTGNGGVFLVNAPAPAGGRTKTKVEIAGSAAAGPRSILKKIIMATQDAPSLTPQTTRTSPKTTVSGKVRNASPSSATSVSKLPTSVAPPRLAQITAAAPTKAEKPLTLNPRLVPISPAGHALRLQLLTLLHKEYVRLHEGKGDPQAMLRLALDEEEKIAREKRVIYTQSMKKRIVNLQKTSVADYQKEQGENRKQVARKEEERKGTMTIHGIIVDHGMDNNKPPLVTGLGPAEELSALRSLLQSWGALGKYGYILEPPMVEEIEVAKKGMEAAGGWECCDRCSARFQVFDGRRESDGQLAGGGQCVYHWGRAAWPLRTRSVFFSSDADKVFTCCRQKVGQSPGCVTCENHVYKVSEAKRLAAIWQFIEIPNPQPSTTETEEKKQIEKAICLDCEMCYTTLGMELIRITATAFPSGEVVVDALVRPKGEILDLNSRFSGIFPKHIVDAQPHSRNPYPPTPTSSDSFINPSSSTLSGDAAEESLTILSSPEAARSLLLSYINSETPIIGHALENDLNALRLCHRMIIDTAILFPHQRGLPLRNKLKWLVEKHLERKIQVDGDFPQGHDSKIDARCAGELVRSAIKEEAARRKRLESRGITDATRMKALKRKGGNHDQKTDVDKDSGGVRLKA